MGNTESIPVVSQVQSLVQVINGDEEGARKTQEQFIRTGIVASQINSLVHSIQGNNDEALKIQEEFAEESQAVPVLGHLIAAGHAIAGNHDKAKQVALDATKTTVVGTAVLGLAAVKPIVVGTSAVTVVVGRIALRTALDGIIGRGKIKSEDIST